MEITLGVKKYPNEEREITLPFEEMHGMLIAGEAVEIIPTARYYLSQFTNQGAKIILADLSKTGKFIEIAQPLLPYCIVEPSLTVEKTLQDMQNLEILSQNRSQGEAKFALLFVVYGANELLPEDATELNNLMVNFIFWKYQAIQPIFIANKFTKHSEKDFYPVRSILRTKIIHKVPLAQAKLYTKVRTEVKEISKLTARQALHGGRVLTLPTLDFEEQTSLEEHLRRK